MPNHSKAERDAAIARLRELAPKGTHIFAIIRHVAPSGLSRVIDLLTINPGREPSRPDIRTLAFNAAIALDWGYSKNHEGLNVKGAGMDMVFHTVETLGRVVHNDSNAYSYRTL